MGIQKAFTCITVTEFSLSQDQSTAKCSSNNFSPAPTEINTS